MSLHAVAVFGLGKNLLFKSILVRCVTVSVATLITFNNSIFAISCARISSLFTIITSGFDIENCAQWAKSTGLVTIKVESIISKIITSFTIKTSITNRATLLLTRSDKCPLWRRRCETEGHDSQEKKGNIGSSPHNVLFGCNICLVLNW